LVVTTNFKEAEILDLFVSLNEFIISTKQCEFLLKICLLDLLLIILVFYKFGGNYDKFGAFFSLKLLFF
jgi:hypothetical protein